MRSLIIPILAVCQTSLAWNVPPSSASQPGVNETCIELTYYDSFGDGWGNAASYIETPYGDYDFTLACGELEETYKLCGQNGLFVLTVLSDETPANYWEVGLCCIV